MARNGRQPCSWARSPLPYNIQDSANLQLSCKERCSEPHVWRHRLRSCLRDLTSIESIGNPAIWCVRTENRFVGENRATSLLTAAAALLAIAQLSPSNMVTILPARCYVAQEWILRAALERALSILPGVKEGVVTLGMMDIDEGVDEDYLAVNRARTGAGFTVLGFARRPTSWAARLLVQQGALFASGIMIGDVVAFAAHISKHLGLV